MGWYAVAFLLGAAIVGAVGAARRRRVQRAPAPLPEGVAYERGGDRLSPARGWRGPTFDALRDVATPSDDDIRERDLADDLRGYLGDVAAQHGAADAMLWLRPSESAPFNPVAWNHQGAPALEPWGTEQQRALVVWAAREGMVSFDGGEGLPSLASARVPLETIAQLGAAGQAGGALVLHSAGGIRGSRQDLKLWLPRHAQRLAQLVELQLTRNEVARANRRMRVLMRNAQDIQVTGEQDAIEERIADSVLEASGATFAALVAWDPEQRTGVVRRTTSQYPAPAPEPGHPVEPTSLAGSVCVDGTQMLWEDVGLIVGRQALFDQDAMVPRTGAMAILPLKRNEATIGALVIGARTVGGIRSADLRTVRLIAQLAASALEAAWEIEEVSRRSRTDQLTGLGNRRDFDDQLKRVLDHADRYGHTCALLLADVDHFKSVNDTYGHQAGDQVLKRIADVMRSLVRATDICARIGGEELCVILPETALGGALELAERLRVTIEGSTVRWREHSLRVTASIGVAIYVGAGKSEPAKAAMKRAQFFEAADRAMYRAKGEGRNCVRSE